MNLAINVERISKENLAVTKEFLNDHEETAQFLIGNLRSNGHELTDHPNSGNFKLIRGPAGVEGVFYLARRGNILVQLNPSSDNETIFDECIQECIRESQKENISIRGFLGDWNSVSKIYDVFLRFRPDFVATNQSKEILYRYVLKPSDAKLKADSRVRCLGLDDFDQYEILNRSYESELNIPNQVDEEAKRKTFVEYVRQRIAWGMYLGDELVSKMNLNATSERVGQVGGVFTPVKYRKKGYAKAVMFHALKDCLKKHGHSKSILFTGETDFPAQKLYESMGYERIGFFGMILS